MKLFIWQGVHSITERWHDDGGLTVVADSLERARELLTKKIPEPVKDQEPCPALVKAPDVERDGVDGPEGVWVFPNAGCC